MNRTFFAPWGNERLPALLLERHCAKCRVLDLAYETSPQEVHKALIAAAPTVAEKVEVSLAEVAERADTIFSWTPDDYIQPPDDPFAILKTGNYEHYAFWGGRGGAKSWGVADALIELASTRKERIAGAREHMVRIKESSKELLDEKVRASPWAEDWSITEYELSNKRTGSVIFFVGLSGGSDGPEGVAKALEGITILWTDEAQLVTKRSLDVILPTVRKAGSRCIWSFNPGQEPSPVDTMFRGESPPERSLVRSLMLEDNPYIYRTRLMSECRSSFARDGEDNYRHIWRGAHLEVTDATIFRKVIYDSYLDWGSLKDGGASAREIAGFDFGYGGPDPSACVRAFVIPGEVCDWDNERDMRPVLYVEGESVQRGVPNHELHHLAQEAGAREVHYDSANPIMGEALNASGVNAYPAAKGPDSVLAGLQTMQSMHIVISPKCPLTAAEIKGLKWATDRKTGKVLLPLRPTGSKHCVDALRYGLSDTEYMQRPTKTKVTWV